MAKTSFNVYRLHFTTPVHLGDSREDYSKSYVTMSSDAMYAAITACLAKIGEKIPDDGDLGCAISDLFPYYQKQAENAKPIYFLPRPLYQSLPQLKDISKAKSIKKVKWLDVTYMQKVLNGAALFDGDGKDLDDIQGDFLCHEKINSKFITSQVSERVTITRNYSEDAVPFYMERVSFAEQSGLYFLSTGNNELIEKGLSILQNEGLGTDRSVGNGFFEFFIDKIELDLPVDKDYVVSLSHFIPESEGQLKEMISEKKSAYILERRGGWITSNPKFSVRKNVIYLFQSGSVFHYKTDSWTSLGRIVDLCPKLPDSMAIGHPVWRCGRSILLPIDL